ncbi:EAL domain-containing protein, partial [Acinetobacter baumannii]
AQGLVGALQRDEFRLAYQPIVDLSTRAVVGYEALIRWVPEPGRVIAPGQFVDIAEETGEIIAIGAWALREATAELARRRMLPGN